MEIVFRKVYIGKKNNCLFYTLPEAFLSTLARVDKLMSGRRIADKLFRSWLLCLLQC